MKKLPACPALLALAALSAGALSLSGCAGTSTSGGLPEALDLGVSTDGEDCRATRRIDVSLPGLGAQYDVFCGAWRRAAGVLRVYPQESASELDGFLDGCQASGEFGAGAAGVLSCPGRTSEDLFRDVALRDAGNAMAVAGRGLPALIPVLQRGAAALAGNAAPVELALGDVAALPGVAALQDQEVLRRRGHQRNASFRFALAAEDFARAASIQDGLFGGDPVRRADIALDLALNLSSQGRFAEAETLLDDSAEQIERLGTPWLADKLINYRAVHLLNKGDLRGAADHAAREFSATTAGQTGTLAAPGAAGELQAISPRDADFVNQRRGADVPPIYADSDLEPGIRAVILKAHRTYILASVLDLRGDDGAAARLDEAARLADAAPANAAPWLRALIREKQALGAIRDGRPEAAAAQLAGILADWRRREPRSFLTAQLLSSLGRAEAAAGRDDRALAAWADAFQLYSGVEGSFGVSPDRAGEYLALLADRTEGGADEAATAEYVSVFEGVIEPRAAAAMAQAAARLGSGTASGEIRQMQDAERALNDAERLLQEEAGTADPVRLQALRTAVDDAEAALLAAEDAARRAQPHYMQLVNRGAGPGDLMEAVVPGEAFVAFTATRSGGFGYAVFDGRIVPFRTDLTGETAAALVRRVRLTLRSRRGLTVPFAVEQAHALFEGVMAPIHAQLRQAGVETVIFSPRGALGSLPPGVLVTQVPPDGGGMRARDYRDIAWLARDFAFISAPSAGSFVATRRAERRSAPGGLTVFGPPVPPGGSQAWIAEYAARMEASGRPARCAEVFARQEALQLPLTPIAPGVARSFNRRTVAGSAFTEAAVLENASLGDQQVLVFATHGFFGDGFCITEPSLLTSLGAGGGDALLSATEILDLTLSADLVFLAACDTARTAEGAQGLAAVFDGAQLDGLVRSFIYAGARAVMATHWVADDKAADTITTRFFAEARGNEMHRALRDAQLSLIGEEAFAHPYFWGPYVIIGDAAHALDARG